MVTPNATDPKKSTKKPARRALSLVSKLAEVQASIHSIQKSGYNQFQKYSYAEEAAIVSACRVELARRHIMILPAIQQVNREDTLTTIFTEYTIIDGESDERLRFIWAGTGADKGDKGLYKAITGSQKYFLMKMFMMPTGDDAEKDSPVVQDDSLEEAYTDWLEGLNNLVERPDATFDALVAAVKAPHPEHGNKFAQRIKKDPRAWESLKARLPKTPRSPGRAS